MVCSSEPTDRTCVAMLETLRSHPFGEHGLSVGSFDAAFFGMYPREAELTDPQHRVFLECAWEALEDGACDLDTYLMKRTDVFVHFGHSPMKNTE